MRVAVVGCSWAGRRHARAYGQDRRQRRTGPRRSNPGRALGLRAARAPREIAVAALDAGKHVLVEKPIATTLADADRMLETAEGARRRLMVAENVYFDPAGAGVHLACGR